MYNVLSLNIFFSQKKKEQGNKWNSTVLKEGIDNIWKGEGDVPTWPFYDYYGHRGVCFLKNSTLFIDRFFFGTHTKSGSVLLHFRMEILPCGWLNHEIGPWYYFMGLLTLKGSHTCIIEFLLIQLIIKMKFSPWEEVSRYL